MNVPALLIFDDGGGRWGPLTDRRSVFELRSGACTIRERIERALGCCAAALHVPERLAAVVTEHERVDVAVNPSIWPEHTWLAVSGRWNGVHNIEPMRALAPGQVLVQSDGQVVAACVAGAGLERFLAAPLAAVGDGLEPVELAGRVLLDRPWHLLDELEAALRADLAASDLPLLDAQTAAAQGAYVLGSHPIRVAKDARVLPGCVFNAEAGPIVIDHGVTLQPFAVLEGPCYVGPGSIVMAHTVLRPCTVIGPVCKVGGEIKASIFQGYANKAHLGYLGDSYVGQWCNLGADTNVSNLKNTYSPVRVQLDADRYAEPTGRISQGPILGDFVRTAIGTRLLTGSVVGTGAMLAVSRMAPKLTPAFAFLTDAGDQFHQFDPLLETARRMMAARSQTLSPAEAALLRRLHTATTTRPT